MATERYDPNEAINPRRNLERREREAMPAPAPATPAPADATMSQSQFSGYDKPRRETPPEMHPLRKRDKSP